MTDKEKSNAFNQGYVCAVAALITMQGGVETAAKELFKAGVGNATIDELKGMGIDDYDLSIIKQYWSELL